MYDRDALLAAVDLRDLADDLLGPAGTNAVGIASVKSPSYTAFKIIRLFKLIAIVVFSFFNGFHKIPFRFYWHVLH